MLGAALAAFLSTGCDRLVTPTAYDSFTAPLGYETSRLPAAIQGAAVCMESSRNDKTANLARVESMVATIVADRPETDVIVFPELCTSWLYAEEDPAGYYRAMAEPIPGPTTEAVKTMATRYGVAVVVGMAEVDADRYYSSQALLQPDGTLVRYRKRGLNERDIANGCTPGEGPVTAKIHGILVTFAICSDYQDPSAIRDLSLSEAPVVLASLATATVLNDAVDFFARSIGKWVVYSNGGGANSGTILPGRVFVADPTGTIHDLRAGPGTYAWFSMGVPE
jgi:(R)-amidase